MVPALEPVIKQAVQETLQRELEKYDLAAAITTSADSYDDIDEQAKIIQKSENIISTALSNGVWDSVSSVKLHNLLTQLPADQRQRLLGSVSHAINEKKMVFANNMMFP